MCEYCSGKYDQNNLVDEGRWYSWIDATANKLVVDMYEGDYANTLKIPINHCPMCGRKLEV